MPRVAKQRLPIAGKDNILVHGTCADRKLLFVSSNIPNTNRTTVTASKAFAIRRIHDTPCLALASGVEQRFAVGDVPQLDRVRSEHRQRLAVRRKLAAATFLVAQPADFFQRGPNQEAENFIERRQPGEGLRVPSAEKLELRFEVKRRYGQSGGQGKLAFFRACRAVPKAQFLRSGDEEFIAVRREQKFNGFFV